MTIDWNAFTPWTALAGGALIGLAAGLLIVLAGRVAGISGIVGLLFRPARRDTAWRLAFVGGLVLSPFVAARAMPLPPVQIEAGPWALMAAGLLVGLGTRWASGCTSGHGVCGLSRLSLRSLVATLAFMAAGVATVFLSRHVLGAA